MRKVDWLTGQIGLRRAQKARSQSMLLKLGELPGGDWEKLYEGSWRVGTNQPRTKELRRARSAGGATAARSFQQRAAMRWLWVRIDPLVSAHDASSFTTNVRGYLVSDSRATGALIEDRVIEDVGIPNYAHARVFEFASEDRHGSGIAWAFTGHVDRIVLLAQCSSYNGSWSWTEATSTVALQVEKIHYSLGTAADGRSTGL
jgi:hypothetical protein